MKVTCPTCKHPIEQKNINVEKDVAFCSACSGAFAISAIVAKTQEGKEKKLAEEITNNPPPGAWKYKNFGNVVIGTTTRSAMVFLFLPFALIFSGVSLGGIYGQQITSGKFNAILSLFGIPFLIASVVLWIMVLCYLFGKVEITIGKESSVFTGIGKLGIRKKFDWNSVVRIYEST